LNAIGTLKEKIKQSGGDIEEKEFDRIMSKEGSKQGVDPRKGAKPENRTSVIDQIKFSSAKKGEKGRLGTGRFNREFAMEK